MRFQSGNVGVQGPSKTVVVFAAFFWADWAAKLMRKHTDRSMSLLGHWMYPSKKPATHD